VSFPFFPWGGAHLAARVERVQPGRRPALPAAILRLFAIFALVQPLARAANPPAPAPVATVAGAGADPSLPPLPPLGTPRSVTQIYAAVCASCHGRNWEGDRAPSMLDDVWAHPHDDEGLTRSIRDGWPENGMPAFGPVLTAQEIRALVVFIRESRERARRTPPPPPREVHGLEIRSELHDFRIERVAGDLDTPWGMAFLPDGRMIVTERPGQVRIIEIGRGVVEKLAGVPTVWRRQDGGLLDIAVHPDYARTGWIYLAYSELGGAEPNGSSVRIIRARIRDGRLVDQETLFAAPPELYWRNNSHYGARFLFDRDGYFYFTIGDRGRPEQSQDLTTAYGKLHRVHDDGRVPADNPFVHHPGAFPSIWSYGHRNQQGVAQHPVTGEIWTAEHGPRGGDELNLTRRGRNYGWPVITYGMNDNGTPITDLTEKEGMEQPVVYWTPSIAVCAIAFYTGNTFPRWKNHLFATALAGRHLRRIVLEGDKATHQEIVFSDLGRVRDVVTGPDGFLYVALNSESQDSPGQIVRLVPIGRSSGS
jgi:aldose sugar dehydrogenase